jgi:lysyl-tRNA synthetase class 2
MGENTFKIRQLAAVAVGALGLDAVLAALAPRDPHRQWLLGLHLPAGLPGEAHVLLVLVGAAMLALTPRVWRGTRTAARLAAVGLVGLAALHLAAADLDEAAIAALLAAVLWLGRRAFSLGCRNRPRLALVSLALGAWALVYCALMAAPLAGSHHRLGTVRHGVVAHALRSSAEHLRLSGHWPTAIELMLLAAALASALALRSSLAAAPGGEGHTDAEHQAARAILDRHDRDSLSPFMLRPDKALAFGDGSVLAYRVIGETAVVSGDPAAPEEAVPVALGRFLEVAHERGWQVALWGASPEHLDGYRRLGLRSLCAGEEAFVDPADFTLEGRRVRKLRQSVHRVERRGWEVVARQGRDLDASLEAEIDALERSWRARQRRLIGFAMGMGRFEAEMRADDLYVLARGPDGSLGAAMRFASHCGRLSLDTMRRCGETPNGLNEALVCRALLQARELGVRQVSLNYAGLAHLVRGSSPRRAVNRVVVELLVRLLAGRFQLERLVRFNEKFSPQWRPRYLVYESRAALPRSVVRVLQAEGYLPGGEGRRGISVRLPRKAPTRSARAGAH